MRKEDIACIDFSRQWKKSALFYIYHCAPWPWHEKLWVHFLPQNFLTDVRPYRQIHWHADIEWWLGGESGMLVADNSTMQIYQRFKTTYWWSWTFNIFGVRCCCPRNSKQKYQIYEMFKTVISTRNIYMTDARLLWKMNRQKEWFLALKKKLRKS